MLNMNGLIKLGKAKSQEWINKGFIIANNAAERMLYKDNLILSDKSAYDVVCEKGLMSLKRYHPLQEDAIVVDGESVPVSSEKKKIPLVFVPPLGATAQIFDLMPTRSLVRYYLARGYDCYLIDWGDPDRSHAGLTFEDYVTEWMPAAIESVQELTGQKEFSLFGYCMGGLFCLLYAAWSKNPDLRNLVTVASPIDVRQVGPAGQLLNVMHHASKVLSRVNNTPLKSMVRPEHLHVPGRLVALSFKLTNPLGSLISYWDLLTALSDREALSEHTTMSNWFEDMADYPGGMIQEIISKLAVGNQFAQGRVRINGGTASFSDIKANLMSFAGDNDKIVGIRAARHLLDVVGSQDKSFYVVPGGHAGVFGGSSASQFAWAMSADWLDERSN
ncbi:polyhydroxyalkanoate synthase [Litoribrevibacter albus]|uniref:Polyhydroxyalkanoate synthase n=1 Tax=Litoribrevibacter albus TaxID=1473156 RepID=A0AA37SDM4_9GAMM|nr:polyhydroxyalkanoate synthase [Litoribrevibacter albus]